jgi:23S rRNA pseudouridine2604 synthase
MEPQRIAKIMSSRGICSRREAERMIAQGWVCVNGIPILDPATRIAPDSEIVLDAHAESMLHQQRTILYHKPVGVVSSQPEKGYTPAIAMITSKNRYHGDATEYVLEEDTLRGYAVAGRLDIDSHGLLVLTQNGTIARRIIGENSSLEKEYLVRYAGQLTGEKLRLLNHGLHLDGRPLKEAQVTILNDEQLKFILHEGRNRQIRRMCDQVGLRVISLKRVRIGQVMLGSLPYGEWRFLAPDESFMA